MNVHYSKLAVWCVVAGLVVFMFTRGPATVPPPSTPPVVVAPPVVLPPSVPANVPPVAAPPPTTDVTPAPVPHGAEAKPKPRPKQVARKLPQRKQGCEDVPARAYQHPVDVVMETARRLGVSGARLEQLRRCINEP